MVAQSRYLRYGKVMVTRSGVKHFQRFEARREAHIGMLRYLGFLAPPHYMFIKVT